MALKTYAAIEVGSNELELKVYEIGKKIGIRQLDHVRYIIELGSDAYSKGFISYELVNELCHVLKKFKLKMDEYQVDDYVAYGGSALREATNGQVIIDQIRVRTGLKVQLISNAQQRFLTLKSIAFQMSNFEQLIKEGAVILDIGAGSIQVSVYQEGILHFTKNIRLGSLRIRELLADLEGQTSDFVRLMSEYITNGLTSYSFTQLSAADVKHVIIVGQEFEYIMMFAGCADKEMMAKTEFEAVYQKIVAKLPVQLAEEMNVPYEVASIMIPSSIAIEKMLTKTKAKNLWRASVDLCDGMALDYSQKVERYLLEHDFTKDVIKSARFIARKFDSDEAHVRNVESLSKELFDATKKISGLNQRHRLLLQLAAILHDTGKFINDANSLYNSYHIIRQCELIGLSDLEKEIVSCIVLYNSSAFIPKYESMSHEIDRESYIDMLKLSAIFGLANAMDKSHRQKIQKIRTTVNETEMKIVADTIYDITLEQDRVEEKADFFEEIFGIRPVLRQKRHM
jgi:exopolyphosphatase / guanosine-5'-triphosphate,3'-diphosphate pyrophosphatase